MKIGSTKYRTFITFFSLLVYILVIANVVMQNCVCVEDDAHISNQCTMDHNCDCCSENTGEPVMMTTTGITSSPDVFFDFPCVVCSMTDNSLYDHVSFARNDIPVREFSDINISGETADYSSEFPPRIKKSSVAYFSGESITSLKPTVLLI